MQGKIGIRAADRFHPFADRMRRPETLLFLPALTLVAMLGGEAALILAALALPLVYLAADVLRPSDAAAAAPAPADACHTTGRAEIIARLDSLRAGRAADSATCLVLRLDDGRALRDRDSPGALDEIRQRCLDRLRGTLRGGDLVAPLDAESWAVALAPTGGTDLAGLLQLAARLQAAIATPSAEESLPRVSASVGLCSAGRAPAPDSAGLLSAAEQAAAEAARNGPGAIRIFSREMAREQALRSELRETLPAALSDGRIGALFQPQLSTDTGAVSGFEAQPVWNHPEHGELPAEALLPLAEEAGLCTRLDERMTERALAALSGWDAAGLGIATVALRLSPASLRQPDLGERLRWLLDRADLGPGRLVLVVPAGAATGRDADSDAVLRNVAGLARQGFGIDLAELGTGPAAITALRRVAFGRLRLDRVLIEQVDRSAGQQRIAAAILSLAERLGFDSLADGVETQGEHAMLAQLGCSYVQGPGIGPALPYAQTSDWIARHRASLPSLPRIGPLPG